MAKLSTPSPEEVRRNPEKYAKTQFAKLASIKRPPPPPPPPPKK